MGSTLIAPLHRTTATQIREVLRVNLDSALYVLQAWVEALRAAGQPGAAAQVADAMAWLLSDHAARITGQVLAVDGGFTSVRPLVK